MLLRVFRENQAFTLLLLLLLSALLWIFTGFKTNLQPNVSLLYNHSAFSFLPGLRNINTSPALAVFFNIFLVLLIGYYLSRLTQRHQLMPSRSFIPMVLFFVFSVPWFATYTGFSYALVCLLVLLFVVDILFFSAESKTLSFSFFNAALLLSLVSLVYFNIFFYLLFVVFLFFRLRGAFWRELVFILLGAAIPYFFLFGILYLTDNSISEYMSSIWNLWEFKNVMETSTFLWVNIAFAVLLFFISSWHAMNQYVKMKIITRKFSVSFLVLFIISLIFALLLPDLNRESLFFLAAPLSFLFGYYFTTCRLNILNQLFFLLFLIGNVGVLVMALI